MPSDMSLLFIELGIVIVGLAAPLQISSPGRLAAARVLSDGSMDATFASGGLFTLALPQYNSLWASAVAMDSQGRIVAGGAAQSSLFGQGGFFALRLTTAGALDPIRPHYVKHDFVRGHEVVCDDAAMALPPNCFGAHYCTGVLISEIA